MADFRAAFQKGMEAQETAKRSSQEIDGVVKEFASQILEATKGKVMVALERRVREVREQETVLGKMAGVLPRSEPVPYEALIARVSLEGGRGRAELCEIERSPYGYPVTLTYGEISELCRSKEALEGALARLLEHPTVAALLNAVMAAHDQPVKEAKQGGRLARRNPTKGRS
jgi:hypothetical protein